MRQLVMIYNASAGGPDERARETAAEALRRRADVIQVGTVQPADVHTVLAEHPDRHPVAVGGDGALHCLVAALAARDELDTRTVGLIPLGTGNDLARSLGIPADPTAAAAVILDGCRRRLDMLADESGGLALNAAHLGIGAEASRAAQPLKPVLRRFAYAVGSVAAGFRSEGWRLRITVDGRLVADGRRRVLMVGVGNGTTIGGGTPLTPDAKPDDGVADVMISFATGPLERLVYATLLRRGRHGSHEQVAVLRGTAITVAGEPASWNVDGEIKEPVRRRTWRLRPGAWHITAPG